MIDHSFRHQRGFLLPLGLFILVGFAALLAALSRFSANQHTSTVFNGLSTQAFYAAESGLQYALHRLQAEGWAEGAKACSEVDKRVIPFNVSGLSACRSSLSCKVNEKHVTVKSMGVCGEQPLQARRELFVKVNMSNQKITWQESTF